MDMNSAWELITKMVGKPDYAVSVAVCPWPDGGWIAAAALLDREYAIEQNLPAALITLPEQFVPRFDIYNGFDQGLNVHASTPEKAIVKLWEAATTKTPASF